MFIELVDALRCPQPHAESWLVVASTRTQARHILEGTLGCPVCRAEYPIVDGVVDFRGDSAAAATAATTAAATAATPATAAATAATAATATSATGASSTHEGTIAGAAMRAAPAAEQATRLAAFLGLDDALGFATLIGAWGALAYDLRDIVECPILLVNPPADVVAAPGLSIIRSARTALPLASGASRGVAVDEPSRAPEAARITKVKGRLVAPVAVPLPADVRELARDAELWVGEREAASSQPVTLHVRRGGSPLPG